MAGSLLRGVLQVIMGCGRGQVCGVEGWVNFLAGVVPEQLEDEIMKVHEAFHQADVRIGPFPDEFGFGARLADPGGSLRACPLLLTLNPPFSPFRFLSSSWGFPSDLPIHPRTGLPLSD